VQVSNQSGIGPCVSGRLTRKGRGGVCSAPTRGESEAWWRVSWGRLRANSAQPWWTPSRALLQRPPDLLVDWTGLRVRARAAGPERWWTMPCYDEAVGNCGGSRTAVL